MSSMKEISKRPKSQLLAMIEEMMDQKAAIEKACNDRFFKFDWNRKGIALPLTDPEKRAVYDYASDMSSELVGEGKIVDRWFSGDNDSTDLDNEHLTTVFETCFQWSRDTLLPQFVGLVIRYSYNKIGGTCLEGVWGLMEIKG